jgi:hypothetical protein
MQNIKAIKKSVRLSAKAAKLFHELTIIGETNFSGSINAMAEQYQLFIADNMPELSENEKTAFYCAFNGYMPNPDIQQELKLLAWHISEGYQYDEQIRELLTEQQAIDLIEKAKSWTASQKLAVIYSSRAYWRQGPI